MCGNRAWPSPSGAGYLCSSRNTEALPEPEGAPHGVAGAGTPLSVLIAGDSAAAGVGVGNQTSANQYDLLPSR